MAGSASKACVDDESSDVVEASRRGKMNRRSDKQVEAPVHIRYTRDSV